MWRSGSKGSKRWRVRRAFFGYDMAFLHSEGVLETYTDGNFLVDWGDGHLQHKVDTALKERFNSISFSLPVSFAQSPGTSKVNKCARSMYATQTPGAATPSIL